MLIDVDRLPQEGLKISQEYEVFSSDLVEANVVFLHPVHVEISVKKIGEEISIKGRIKTCLSFICSRCLVPFEFSVDFFVLVLTIFFLKPSVTTQTIASSQL